MHDSTVASDIPVSATMVAGYIDHSHPWTVADWGRFPHAVKVRIARGAGTTDGHVLDVETGLATPTQAPGWVRMRRAAGIDPTVYCNASAQATIQTAFRDSGVAQPHYWVARYDNIASVPVGTVAKQYIDNPLSGGHYDLSVVADYWPGIDPVPLSPLTPIVATDDEDTVMLIPAGTNEHVVLPCAGRPLFFYLYAANGRHVDVHQIDFVMPTRSVDRFVPGAGFSSGDGGDGDGGTPWVWESDKPGPETIPRHPNGAQPVGVSIRYTADHAFTGYVG